MNTPLAESENENARKLVKLDEQLTVDLADQSPAASHYARRRPFLLSETLARECRFGYMAGNSKSTLGGKWVFGVMNQEGQPLAWVGRNVRYEEEYERWAATGRHPRGLAALSRRSLFFRARARPVNRRSRKFEKGCVRQALTERYSNSVIS